MVQRIDNITDNINVAKPQLDQDKMLFGNEALSPLLFGSRSKSSNLNTEILMYYLFMKGVK
jgi:hypothetical protein